MARDAVAASKEMKIWNFRNMVVWMWMKRLWGALCSTGRDAIPFYVLRRAGLTEYLQRLSVAHMKEGS